MADDCAIETQVIVLNGGSSSGKSGIARCLQAILPRPWISMGVDNLVDALPPSLAGPGPGIAFGQRGEVVIGDGFRAVEAAWVGVRCDPAIAAAREVARGDRVTGMAASQAELVHAGVVYDLEVDTGQAESLDCARVIAARVLS